MITARTVMRARAPLEGQPVLDSCDTETLRHTHSLTHTRTHTLWAGPECRRRLLLPLSPHGVVLVGRQPPVRLRHRKKERKIPNFVEGRRQWERKCVCERGSGSGRV